MKKIVVRILVVVLVIFGGIQFIPVTMSNPPVTHAVKWDSPETKATFMAACADCHSNETKWPWYAKVAPVSWLLADHVEEGREHFNISQPDMGDSDEAWEAVHEGWMPLDDYKWMHPEARLTEEQQKAFAVGLKATFGSESPSVKEEH